MHKKLSGVICLPNIIRELSKKYLCQAGNDANFKIRYKSFSNYIHLSITALKSLDKQKFYCNYFCLENWFKYTKKRKIFRYQQIISEKNSKQTRILKLLSINIIIDISSTIYNSITSTNCSIHLRYYLIRF